MAARMVGQVTPAVVPVRKKQPANPSQCRLYAKVAGKQPFCEPRQHGYKPIPTGFGAISRKRNWKLRDIQVGARFAETDVRELWGAH